MSKLTLRIASDIHTEFQPDGGRELFAKLADGDFDVLVIAGDLSDSRGLLDALRYAVRAAGDRLVLYVPGNHEHYGSSIRRTKETLDEFERHTPNGNLRVLDNSSCTVKGHEFVGSTLWFPDIGPGNRHAFNLNDYHQIQGFAGIVKGMATDANRYLRETVQPGDIVITHHLPHPKSIAPRLQGSSFNRFFLHDVSDIMAEKRPQLWIHGHTHFSCDYVVGDTRVVCNPLGYMVGGGDGEPNPEFSTSFDVTIGEEK